MATRELILEEVSTQTTSPDPLKLVLWNDEVNTFDWVIQCLVKVCEHEPIQAEQCAWITHLNGKCQVLHGDYDYLKPRAESLLEKGLSVTID